MHSGGYLNPCLFAGDGGAGGASDQCRAYELVGAYWNGALSNSCIEPVDDISATTGRGIERGELGDLNTWSNELVETEDALRVGTIGLSLAGALELHMLELASGVSRSVPIARDYSLAGALSSGSFVGAYFASGSLIVDRIDPLTGTTTRVTSVASIGSWGSQIVLDRAVNHAYTLADSPLGATRLYDIDLSNGASSSRPLSWNGYLGGVTTDGQIVAMSRFGGEWVVSVIDPPTAIATKRGTFGELDGASYVVYDSTLNVAHTVSSNVNGVQFLYNVALASGAASRVEVKHPYILAKQ